MIVPVFEVDCRAACLALHCRRFCFSRNATLVLPQGGHVTPFGQPRATK